MKMRKRKLMTRIWQVELILLLLLQAGHPQHQKANHEEAMQTKMMPKKHKCMSQEMPVQEYAKLAEREEDPHDKQKPVCVVWQCVGRHYE